MKKSKDVEGLYENYVRYQLGDKSALDELFAEVGKKAGETNRIVELEEEYKLSHTEDVLDAGLVQNEIECRRNDRKLKVVFSFPCLNDIVRKAKYSYSKNGIFTGYGNGKKIDFNGYKKFHSGKYDTLELEEVMQEIVIKIFQGRLSGSRINITDGVTLLKNIKYYLTIEIGKNNEILCKNVPETYIDAKGDARSYFDQYSEKNWIESKGQISRILPYSECLEWIKRNDVDKLFKANACDIKAIIETIMNCEDTFEKDVEGDIQMGFGMRFVTQKELHEMIKSRHNINIDQENISKDLGLIEQRLLDHLFYSLNYGIEKAEESKGIYEKESKRFLYELDKRRYIKIFSRAEYELYVRSGRLINSNANSGDLDRYFKLMQKYEDMVIKIVSLEKGKKKYDMVNLMVPENNDLVGNENETILNIAHTIIEHYQKAETEYQKKVLGQYRVKSFSDWENGYWEAELCSDILKIRLFSSEKIKNPIKDNINREKLIVYCGCMHYYFCNVEKKMYYKFPKNRRIISRANKKHEIFMYKVD